MIDIYIIIWLHTQTSIKLQQAEVEQVDVNKLL